MAHLLSLDAPPPPPPSDHCSPPPQQRRVAPTPALVAMSHCCLVFATGMSMDCHQSPRASYVASVDATCAVQQQVTVLDRITDQVKGWVPSLQRLQSGLQGVHTQLSHGHEQLQRLQNAEAQLRRSLHSNEENLGLVEEERRLLLDERDTLALEADRLKLQCESIAAERDRAQQEQGQLGEERDALLRRQRDLLMEHDAMEVRLQQHVQKGEQLQKQLAQAEEAMGDHSCLQRDLRLCREKCEGLQSDCQRLESVSEAEQQRVAKLEAEMQGVMLQRECLVEEKNQWLKTEVCALSDPCVRPDVPLVSGSVTLGRTQLFLITCALADARGTSAHDRCG